MADSLGLNLLAWRVERIAHHIHVGVVKASKHLKFATYHHT